jgi:hypothetical protein
MSMPREMYGAPRAGADRLRPPASWSAMSADCVAGIWNGSGEEDSITPDEAT